VNAPRFPLTRIVTLFVLGLVVCACSGGRSSTPNDFPRKVADAACTYGVRCGFVADRASCSGAINEGYGQALADVSAGKTRFDDAAAAKCLSAISSLSCNRSERLGGALDACGTVFKGTGAVGGPCFVDTECASGRCDTGSCDQACCHGVCEDAVLPKPEGSDCFHNDVICVEGTSCQLSGASTATCQPRVGEGEPCVGTADECAVGMTCFAAAGTGGTCRRYPSSGGDCDPAQLPCDGSHDVCDAATMKCVPAHAVGQACAGGDCVGFATCDATTMKCVHKGGPGASCSSPDECLGDLECTSSQCTLPPADPLCGVLAGAGTTGGGGSTGASGTSGGNGGNDAGAAGGVDGGAGDAAGAGGANDAGSAIDGGAAGAGSADAGGMDAGDAGGSCSGGAGGTSGLGGAAGACNTLVNAAPPVVQTRVAEAAPAPAGGTIVDGTYFLTSAIYYTGPGGLTRTDANTPKAVLVISNAACGTATVQDVSSDPALGYPDSHETVTFKPSGTQVSVFGVCPPSGNSGLSIGYTATPTTFALLRSDGFVRTYKKQ
jgi:hypothetical protein